MQLGVLQGYQKIISILKRYDQNLTLVVPAQDTFLIFILEKNTLNINEVELNFSMGCILVNFSIS